MLPHNSEITGLQRSLSAKLIKKFFIFYLEKLFESKQLLRNTQFLSNTNEAVCVKAVFEVGGTMLAR